MRAITLLVLALSTGITLAEAKRPQKFESIAEPPPLAAGTDDDGAVDRRAHITPRASETIKEYRPDGKHVVRIGNPNGSEYLLIEERGDGTYGRQNPSDAGVRIPQWIHYEF